MKHFIVIASVMLLNSCDYSYNKQIGESYFLRAVNSPVTMSIGFGTKEINEGVIDQTVFEVYWNDDYILAKRHPSKGAGINNINKNVIEYYIIKKVLFGEEKAAANIKGPLSEDLYEKEKNVLGLDERTMQKVEFEKLK